MTRPRLGDLGLALAAAAAFLIDPFLLAINIVAGVVGSVILCGLFALCDGVPQKAVYNVYHKTKEPRCNR